MPRIALLSDIHGNLPALEVVIERLKKEKPDYWICLGDLVGYGPFPNECINVIRDLNMKCILGNHDSGVCGIIPLTFFKDPNRKLLQKSKGMISSSNLKWLESLPLVLKNEAERWIAAHASPNDPYKWKYVDSAITARNIISELDYDFCFVGHTHIPALVSNRIGINNLKKGYKYLINPGSVGQPRDQDYRASCAILDTDDFELKIHKLEYKIQSTIDGLIKLGFTSKESNRLMLV